MENPLAHGFKGSFLYCKNLRRQKRTDPQAGEKPFDLDKENLALRISSSRVNLLISAISSSGLALFVGMASAQERVHLEQSIASPASGFPEAFASETGGIRIGMTAAEVLSIFGSSYEDIDNVDTVIPDPPELGAVLREGYEHTMKKLS